LSEILKSLNGETLKPNSPKISSSQLRDSKNILDHTFNKDDGVFAHEEEAFSTFKVEFYQDQLIGLENLMDEWVSVEDDNGSARAQIAQIRKQMNLVRTATSFWEGRQESWQEKMEGDQPKPGDDAFSVFKLEFYRSQFTGLENLMDEWASVEDDSGQARAQIAQIRQQIEIVEAADSFWVEENQFWRKEHKSEYKVEDQKAVKDIYTEIEDYQVRYDNALLGESNESAFEIKLELEKTKDKLDKYRIGYAEQAPIDGFKMKFPEEQVFADFKIDFYDSQTSGLENLMDEWVSVEDDSGQARAQVAQIRKQIRLVDSAKNFWKEQDDFWKSLEEKDFATENKSKLDDLTGKAVDLEAKIEEAMFILDDTGRSRASVAQNRAELNAIKSEIYSLAV
jgi:hypothetical protein